MLWYHCPLIRRVKGAAALISSFRRMSEAFNLILKPQAIQQTCYGEQTRNVNIEKHLFSSGASRLAGQYGSEGYTLLCAIPFGLYEAPQTPLAGIDSVPNCHPTVQSVCRNATTIVAYMRNQGVQFL